VHEGEAGDPSACKALSLIRSARDLKRLKRALAVLWFTVLDIRLVLLDCTVVEQTVYVSRFA